VTVLSDAEIVEALRTKFVPVAVDQHDHRRRKDAEGELFAKVLKQAGRGLDGTSQGYYLFTPAGKLLEFSNTVSGEHVKKMLEAALRKYDPASDDPVPAEAGPKDARHEYVPPAGGLVLDVTSKVLAGYEESSSRHAKIYQASLGRDHLWLRKDEAEALARGTFPESARNRLARFHLVDNTRGEPPFWRPDEVRALEVVVRDGRLTGTVHLETAKGDRGYRAALAGRLEATDGKVSRLDMIARGDFWGEGTFTRGAPPGKFPFGVAFTISPLKDEADKAPPGGARGNLQAYLR
jgi:hypothetical protein